MCVATSTIVGMGIVGATTAVSTVASSRAQTGASQRGLQYQQSHDARAEAWEREQEEYRRSEAARVAEEDKKRWETDEANRKQAFEISEGERLRKIELDRWQQDRQAKLDAMTEADRKLTLQREAEREARLAPYREASKAALGRLQGIITAPGAGISPAAHQFSQPTTLRDVMPR